MNCKLRYIHVYIDVTVTWSNCKVLDQVDRHGSPDQTSCGESEFDLVICACQRDVIRLFGSSYCYNDKFIVYPFNFIEKVWNKYLGSTVPQSTFIYQRKTNLKRTINNLPILSIYAYHKPWERSWVENHSKCIKKMCLGFRENV